MHETLDLDLDRARELGDQGAARAAAKANRVHGEWSAIASATLARIGPALGEFQTEEIRAVASDVPPPPDARAWGSVMKTAQALGWIEFVRYEAQKSTNCHGSPKAVWRWVHVPVRNLSACDADTSPQ